MDKNCNYWSDGYHEWELHTINDINSDPIKHYYRKVCMCGAKVKSRAELTDNPKQTLDCNTAQYG